MLGISIFMRNLKPKAIVKIQTNSYALDCIGLSETPSHLAATVLLSLANVTRILRMFK